MFYIAFVLTEVAITRKEVPDFADISTYTVRAVSEIRLH